ncbi:RNA polymerase sigma factor [Sphingomonas sp.]|uniref:RNA polymerase sigma factor n=1 Tax=Sphingomonas sp. TaxID=28214 RepID=UPI0031D62435
MTETFRVAIPALRKWFGRRLPNPADIDDAVQDVWIRAHSHLASGHVISAQAYLFQTAQSVLQDRARRASTRQQAFHETLEDHHHPVEGITPDRVLLGKDEVARIAGRLAELPERRRDIFILHRFEGMSYGEIAKAHAISVSAVEKHIMKALRFLMEDRP